MSVPLTSIRFSGYGQWSRKDKIAVKYGTMREYESIIGGYRADVSGSAQTTFSRAQFAIKPDWEKIWSLGFQEVYTISHRSTERRDAAGVVQPNVKAQQSVHFVLSNDYSFKMWDRPKLVSGCIINLLQM
jgi:hypothetical protein